MPNKITDLEMQNPEDIELQMAIEESIRLEAFRNMDQPQDN